MPSSRAPARAAAPEPTAEFALTPSADVRQFDRWAAFQNAAFMRYWLSRLASSFGRADPDGGGRLAGLRPDARPARPRLRRPVAVPAGAAARARHRSGRRPFSAAHDHGGLPGRSKRSARWRCSPSPRSGISTTSCRSSSILGAFGTARAFYSPAQQSLLPNLVPPEILSSAIALNSLSWQLATICGPVARRAALRRVAGARLRHGRCAASRRRRS